MTVVSVLSMKGGVGKSTVALGLASAAWSRGLRTLLIDLDPQANATMAVDVGTPEFTASDELRHELQQHCKHTAAPYKYPREIEFVSELPKTISGKTRRFELRRQKAPAEMPVR